MADTSKVVRYVISGTWDAKIDCAKVVYHKTGKGTGNPQKGTPQTLPATTIWQRLIPG